MLILAIDTALEACSAAVLDTDANRLLASESEPMQRGHAEALVPMLARVMQASGLGFAELDRIAVTTGPGSFTGLRVGLSAARGIALAADKPVVGLTTLSAYAAPLVSERDDTPILSAIDARHDHVYYQLVSGNGTRLVRPRVGPIAEALEAARQGPPRLVGNAAALLAARWPALTPPAPLIDQQPAPDIFWIAWLGAAANPEVAPARPFYLRAPDAKPQADALARAAQPAA
ncbi:tRNA (adenosine(37)-N6)-threonylcarbamoyltransferase complex dimerization subunit type 1 TsaB [Rhodopseudomonas palustris]|uniref:tRNA (Adenosine(37)-N6)-threonylcarbamoyltransferase complex dimerization subunit type 1 TsaB n=1 Tax=Rhodopseudomonas palustris TaxID=1076 RepID=A0A418VIR0_RHOPL|nr:tRNA (adenosine(37)-N6)-threonylcarbamoyltransferase complex dimerization subunit type 1 TsaB [Rhodopseudomonas palustris]RJF75991.1 tRNA (adenosine(37)-N6)-threonylcarbamoyltransferase complex dimerization subunit type 1 TsaB [Rhodopseudomonas palustris]